jgi:hypothetical protein
MTDIVDALPPAMNKNEPQGVFDDKADVFFAALPIFGQQLNSLRSSILDMYQSIINSIATVSALISTVNVVAGSLLVRSSNTVLGTSDNAKTIVCTAAYTQTLTAAATLGNGWFVNIHNNSAATVTIDPSGSELVLGLSTYSLTAGMKIMLYCDGVGFGVDVKTASASNNNTDIELRKLRNAKYY